MPSLLASYIFNKARRFRRDLPHSCGDTVQFNLGGFDDKFRKCEALNSTTRNRALGGVALEGIVGRVANFLSLHEAARKLGVAVLADEVEGTVEVEGALQKFKYSGKFALSFLALTDGNQLQPGKCRTARLERNSQ